MRLKSYIKSSLKVAMVKQKDDNSFYDAALFARLAETRAQWRHHVLLHFYKKYSRLDVNTQPAGNNTINEEIHAVFVEHQ